MNEKYKAKLKKAKELAKKHGPVILAGALAIVASGIAVRNHKLVVQYETIDPNEFPVIEVHPKLMEDVKNGATLMYREASTGNNYYAQSTTIGWTDEANEEFEAFKNGEL